MSSVRNFENSTYLGSTGSSRMLKHLPLPFIHKFFEHLTQTLLHCIPLAYLLLPQAWWTSLLLWVTSPKCGLQFQDLHIADDFSLCLYSAICSNGYSLEFIVPQNFSPPKSLHSVFSLSGHHLFSLVIQLLPPQLFLDYIRTSSALAY